MAILIVFAILLTRSSEVTIGEPEAPASWWSGLLIALAVGGSLAAAVTASVVRQRGMTPAPRAPVLEIGERLLHEFVVPLEVIGLLLTAAMIGAVIIALPDKKTKGPEQEESLEIGNRP